MKVKKQVKKTSVQSSEMIPNTTTIGNITDVLPTQDSPYASARSFIQSAIGALTVVAHDDPIAKDSIANLAVVLMDLQSC